MRTVFVDTSGFYALLDGQDPFHGVAKNLFYEAEKERWHLVTTSYVVQESWALIQHRLGWPAVDDFLDVILPMCSVRFVDERLHSHGSARCRQARARRLSLTDCVSFELAQHEGIVEAIADDADFRASGLKLPD